MWRLAYRYAHLLHDCDSVSIVQHAVCTRVRRVLVSVSQHGECSTGRKRILHLWRARRLRAHATQYSAFSGSVAHAGVQMGLSSSHQWAAHRRAACQRCAAGPQCASQPFARGWRWHSACKQRWPAKRRSCICAGPVVGSSAAGASRAAGTAAGTAAASSAHAVLQICRCAAALIGESLQNQRKLGS